MRDGGRVRCLWPVGFTRSAAIVAVLLIVAVGLCVFDHDSDGVGDESFDLCLALVVAVIAVDITVIMLAARRPLLETVCCVSAPAPHLPDPPPKFQVLV